jgi:hypothetical protein
MTTEKVHLSSSFALAKQAGNQLPLLLSVVIMPMLVFPPSSSKVTREAISELRRLLSKNQSCRISGRT